MSTSTSPGRLKHEAAGTTTPPNKGAGASKLASTEAPRSITTANGHHAAQLSIDTCPRSGSEGGGFGGENSPSPLPPPPVPQSSPLPPTGKAGAGAGCSSVGGVSASAAQPTSSSLSGHQAAPGQGPGQSVSGHTSVPDGGAEDIVSNAPVSSVTTAGVVGQGEAGMRGGGRGNGRLGTAPLRRGGHGEAAGDFTSPRPLHPGSHQGAPMPSLPTRVSSAPPAENVQVYESTQGYYQHAMNSKQAFPQRRQHGSVHPASSAMRSPYAIAQHHQQYQSPSALPPPPSKGQEEGAPSQRGQSNVGAKGLASSQASTPSSSPLTTLRGTGSPKQDPPQHPPPPLPSHQHQHQQPPYHPKSPAMGPRMAGPPSPYPQPPAPVLAGLPLYGTGALLKGGPHHGHQAQPHHLQALPGHPPMSPQQGPGAWLPPKQQGPQHLSRGVDPQTGHHGASSHHASHAHHPHASHHQQASQHHPSSAAPAHLSQQHHGHNALLPNSIRRGSVPTGGGSGASSSGYEHGHHPSLPGGGAPRSYPHPHAQPHHATSPLPVMGPRGHSFPYAAHQSHAGGTPGYYASSPGASGPLHGHHPQHFQPPPLPPQQHQPQPPSHLQQHQSSPQHVHQPLLHQGVSTGLPGGRYSGPPARGYVGVGSSQAVMTSTSSAHYSPTFPSQTSTPLPSSPNPRPLVKRESKALAILDKDNKIVKPSTGTPTSSTPLGSPSLGAVEGASNKATASPKGLQSLPQKLNIEPTASSDVDTPPGTNITSTSESASLPLQADTGAVEAAVKASTGPDIAEKEEAGLRAPGSTPGEKTNPSPQQATSSEARAEETSVSQGAPGAKDGTAPAATSRELKESSLKTEKEIGSLAETEASKASLAMVPELEKGDDDISKRMAGVSIVAESPLPRSTVSKPGKEIRNSTEESCKEEALEHLPAKKHVYVKVVLESLKPIDMSQPAELVGRLQVTRITGSSGLGGVGLGMTRTSGIGSSINRSGPSITTLEEGPWVRKPLSMDRKSSDSLSGSRNGYGGLGGASPGGSSSGSGAGGSGGSAWRRGEQVPIQKSREAGGGNTSRAGPSADFARRRENVGLARSRNAWSPQRDTSGLEHCEARVRGLLNKMTWDTFDKLSTQLCGIEIDSKDMLSKIISLVFDKAVDEPFFGEMYATLCVDVSKKSGEWSVIRTGQDLDKNGKYFWTDDIMVEKEIVGPFPSREACLEAAISDQEPIAQARTQKLRLCELIITGDKFVKVLESMEGGSGAARQYFTVFRALTEEEEGQERVRDRIHGGFEDEMSAMEDGHRATTFKKLLLKKCQEEFYKENNYDDTVRSTSSSGASRQELAQRQAEEEEARMKSKRRMLGNIRFIGELYKKKMLKERIMHECILKLLGFVEQRGDRPGDRKLVKRSTGWDEESLEALCKLLSTVGEQLDEVKCIAGDKQRTKGRPPPEHHEKDITFYYKQLRDLSVDKKSGLTARARFMIKDLLELRENKWVLRRVEVKATKTEEFRRGMEASKSGSSSPSGSDGRSGQHGGSGGRGSAPSPVLSRQGSLDKSGRGTAGGGGDKRSLRGGVGETIGRDRRGNIPPAAMDRRGGPGRNISQSPMSDHGDERGARGSLSSNCDSKAYSRPSMGGTVDGPGVSTRSREEVDSVVQTVIAEFMSLRDEAEVEASMDLVPRLVGSEVAANKILGRLIDCKDNERGPLIQLLLLLIKSHRIQSKDLKGEVQLVMETLEDLLVDVPHVYDNFSFAVAALLRTKALDFAWFQSEARGALPEEKAFTRLMTAVFRAYDADRRAPWSWDLVKSAGEVLFAAYHERDRCQFMNFVEEHQLWATYVEPLSGKIVEQAMQKGGTEGILAWIRSLEPSLRNNVPFTRALAYRLLVECPKVRNSTWPQPAELQTLFTEIAANADPRLQVACLHGMQRFVIEFAATQEKKAMLVSLFDELVRSGAVLPGTLSAWEQDLGSTPDSALASDVVVDVMNKLGADPVVT